MKKLVVLLGLPVAGSFLYLTLFGSIALPRVALAQNAPSTQAVGTAAAATGSPTAAVTNTSSTGSGAAAAPAPAKTRPWDPGFLQTLYSSSEGSVVTFELVGGRLATGTIRHIDRKDGQVLYVTGELSEPEKGRFFFQKQTGPGKAGDFAGVVELPASKVGYRIEPVEGGGSQLVELPLDRIICLVLPMIEEDGGGKEEIPPLNPSDFKDYPIPDYQEGIIPLQSLPGVVPVAYIDYRGGYTPTWGGITYEKPNVSNAQIRDVWKRVAEDFLPFNINVTTDIRVYNAAPETSRQRCVVTPTTTAAPGAGGVAYLNSWNWSGDTPCWVFMTSGKSCAEAVSHELGHTLQLVHDGTASEGYYGGQGSGEVGWAPIMGVGYYQPVSQWSKGEYSGANNSAENDLLEIVNNNNSVDYRLDDTGPLLATSRYLEMYTNFGFAQGVIETTGDADAFQFTTAGGTVSLRANPVGNWGNLAMSLSLYNSSDVLVATNNPSTTLWAAINVSAAPGTYTVRVTGVGRNDPLINGFSSYASLGYYSVTGTVANARQPTRLTVAENTPNGTVVGTIPPLNATGDPLAYRIVSGNTGTAFSLNNSGALTVFNNSVLNYENLGKNSSLPVQYELLVNITNLANPSLTEVNRRVVVAVEDINEAPVMAGTNTSVFEHSAIGTLVATVSATDPDFYNLVSYSLAGGDTNGMFTVGSQNGEIRVAGDLVRSVQSTYVLQVRASDQVGPYPMMTTSLVTVAVLPNNSPLQPGGISYAVYTNLAGSTLPSLTNATVFPHQPAFEKLLTRAEGDVDRGDTYGSVLRGYVIAPATGTYTFWLASDDDGDLWMSTTTNPATMTRIAYVSGYTSPRQWTKFTSQQSTARTLVGGQAYYIEARQKEDGGGDHVAIGWSGPGISGPTVIPGNYLAPFRANYVPSLVGFNKSVRRDAFQGSRIGRVVNNDPNTTDTISYVILSGNDEGIFGIDKDGWVMIADATALTNTPFLSHALYIQATDSGTPPLSATAWAYISVREADSIIPTSLQQEMFYSINGSTVASLTGNIKYPRLVNELKTLSDFTTPANVADNYGSRIRGYVIPPVSGDYRFFIASDDASQLKLSANTNPATAVVIASVAGATGASEWTKEATQTSPIRTLVGGERYYIEVLHKEGGGSDHANVAWLVPGSGVTNLIPSWSLEPADINIAPAFSSQTLGIFAAAANGTLVGRVIASDSPLETLTYRIVDGNTNDTFAIVPGTGDITVNNNALLADGSVTTVSLLVMVQDSGLGGLYPARTSQATVTINVLPADSPLVWSGGAAGNNWSDAMNWRGVAPVNGARLIFGFPNQQTNVNNSLTSLDWVQITNSGFSFSGNPVSLSGGITNVGSNVWALRTTLAGPQTWQHASGTLWTLQGGINNNGNTLTLVGNGDVRVSGTVSGTGGLTKSGSGRLLIQGAHSYSGPTVVGPAFSTANAMEVSGADDLDLSLSDVTMNGRMDLSNHNATIGALSGSGIIYANSGTRGLFVGANNGSGTFSGTLSNNSVSASAALAFVKVGSGTQTLSGQNRHSAGTTVRAGQLLGSSVLAFGTGPVALGDNASGTNSMSLLATSAVTITNSLSVSMFGTGTPRIGTVDFNPSGLNMQFTGPLALNRNVTLQAGSTYRTTFGGLISGAGGVEITSPFAAGRLVVFDRGAGGTNSFGGDVSLGTNAALQIGANNAIGNRVVPDGADVLFDSGSQLKLAPGGNGDTEMLGGLNSLLPESGLIDMASGFSFTLGFGANNANAVFSGGMHNSQGQLALVKVGVGRQVLGGNSTFTGLVTVSNGVIAAIHPSALGGSSVGTAVRPGATLEVSGGITLAEPVTLAGEGYMGTGALRSESGTNVLTGPVFLAGPAAIAAGSGSLSLAGPWTTSGNTVTFTPSAGAVIRAVNGIGGAGPVVKTGAGLLVLEIANGFTGPVAVNEGTMALGTAGSLPDSEGITLGAGAVFNVTNVPGGWTLEAAQAIEGDGRVIGPVTLNGAVRPGSSIGTLAFSGSVTLAGSSEFEINKSGAILTNDVLACSGSLTLGGALVVTNTGDALGIGDAFKIIAASSATGAFAALQLPLLPDGASWDVSTVATDGTIRVVAGKTAGPSIGVAVSGGNMTLTWPSDSFGYVLQGQTNAPGLGIGGNWQSVDGVTNNSYTVPLDQQNGSVFFRLLRQ